jgi:signal peptidase II
MPFNRKIMQPNRNFSDAPMLGNRLLPWLAIAVVVLLTDQLTKIAVASQLSTGTGIEVTSFFNIVHAFNEGAAFGFLDSEPGWQRYFFTLVAAAVSAFIIYMLRKGARRAVSIALSLVLGGAVGNAIDRIAYGHVVDFLDFHLLGKHFYTFNVADIAICIGAFLIMFCELFPGGVARQATTAK